MGTTAVSAQHSGIATSPFLDLVDVPAEVRSSVRRIGGRATAAVVSTRSNYRRTIVGSGPWRLTQAGRQLVRAVAVTAIVSLSLLSLVAGISSAMSAPGPSVATVGPADGPPVPRLSTSGGGGEQGSVVIVAEAMRPLSLPAVGGVLDESALGGAVLAATGVPIGIGGGSGAVRVDDEWTVVRPGDTLWDIARRADPKSDPREMLVKLRDANGDRIANPVAGQRVRLPRG